MKSAKTNLKKAVIAPIDNRGATRWNVLGMDTICIVASEDTGGEYSVVETIAEPNQGPPLHIHENEDEIFVVIEGKFEIICGDTTYTVQNGDVAVLPRRIPHTFRNTGEKNGRILQTISPGGFENFFAEVSRDINPEVPDFPKLSGIAERYNLHFII
jgi:mannose-6-phosphate isomerase-like protein (cupin superfamily)